MPRIHRRPIERLKSNRSLNVYRAKSTQPVHKDEKPVFRDRRGVRERRKKKEPVKYDRRANDRRLSYFRSPPAIKRLMENAQEDTQRMTKRSGVFIDEEV